MHKISNKKLFILILSIEFILYFLVCFGFNWILSNSIVKLTHIIFAQYIFILVNSLFSLLFTKKLNFVHYGLLITPIADFFLTFLNLYSLQQLELGVFFFLLVQLMYFFFLLTNQNKKGKTIHITIRILVSILVPLIEVILLKENTNVLFIVSGIYGANIILNCIYSFTNFKKYSLLAIGLLLFIYCDLVIMLNTLNGTGVLVFGDGSFLKLLTSWTLSGKGLNVTWLTYMPSQFLIALFALKQN